MSYSTHNRSFRCWLLIALVLALHGKGNRFLNFVFSCMSCGSELVRFFVRFGVQQACMKSPLERNARFCAVRFGLSASDIGRYKLNRICFADKFASYLPAGFMDRASFAYEAIAIREGRLTMMNLDFSMEDVDEIIAYLVSDCYMFFTVFFSFSFFLCVYLCLCVCTSCTISIINK